MNECDSGISTNDASNYSSPGISGKTRKRTNFGLMNAGIMFANILGLDICSLLCDKKDGLEEDNGNISSNNDANGSNGTSETSASDHKHATYHGSTKYHRMPLDMGVMSRSAAKGNSSRVGAGDCSNYYPESSQNLLQIHDYDSEKQQKALELAFGSFNIGRRSSSTTSIGSSNINPSFEFDEELPSGVISYHNQQQNSSQHLHHRTSAIQRPTTLNLQNSNMCRKYNPGGRIVTSVIPGHLQQDNSNSCCTCYQPSSCSSTPSSPACSNCDCVANRLSYSPRTVRFNLRDGGGPSHTLLDMSMEGQSQDGTVPLTALFCGSGKQLPNSQVKPSPSLVGHQHRLHYLQDNRSQHPRK